MRLAILVASIALVDSINPSTVAPALYLTTVSHPRRRVSEFAAGVFAVNLAGGILIVLGPGQLAHAILPHPGATAKHAIELAAGVALLAFGLVLLIARRRAARMAPVGAPSRREAWALGAAIAAAELPTAFPYFAALAAIVGSNAGLPRQGAMVLLFNAIFIAPVMMIALALALGGPGAERRLRAGGDWLRERWPILFGSLALAAGALLIGFGLEGLLAGR